MKKVIFIITLMALTFVACAQQVSKTNITIEKVAPVLYLNGTSAAIDWYNSDIILQQSSNLLTLSGGNFSLGSNSLLSTGSLGSTGSRLTKGWFTDLEITNLPTINGGTLSSALSLSSYLLKSDTASMLTNYALISEVDAAAGFKVDSVTVYDTNYYTVFDNSGDTLAPHIPDAYSDDPYDIFTVPHVFAGDTSNYPIPDKIGDLFINTLTRKMYFGAATARGGWEILNLILPVFFVLNLKRRRRK